MEKVVLGLSDGVDSAVAAYLLKKEGYHVTGLYLDLGGEKERMEAERSAELLGIPLTVQPVKEELERYVCAPFAMSYLRGETPNPCLTCNPTVKLPSLIRCADRIGARFIATGHYVRTDGRFLYTGAPSCDQSYMLCRTPQDQVRRLLLPLGETSKDKVRDLARDLNLPVADKPDSRENCFIRGMTYADWIEKRGVIPSEGPVILNGTVVGKHRGIHRWTVGQRWEELIGERRAYVQAIEPEANVIRLCLWEDLFTCSLTARDPVRIGPWPESPFRATVRVRHTRWEMPGCTVCDKGDTFTLRTDEPLRAPTPGQSAALYIGDRLIGSGFITAEET